MRIGIISDIHEDFTSLLKAIRILEKNGCTELVCLGDLVGYNSSFSNYSDTRDASLCLEIVVDTCSHILPGNHDLFAVRKVPLHNPGFKYPNNWYDLSDDERVAQAKNLIWAYVPHELPNNLSEQQKELIRSLPEFKIIESAEKKILLSHYLFPDLTGSGTVLPPTAEILNSHMVFMNQQKADWALYGHCHPEGLSMSTGGAETHINFNRTISLNEYPILGIPCVANGSNTPGVAVLDTSTVSIKSISIRSGLKRFFS